MKRSEMIKAIYLNIESLCSPEMVDKGLHKKVAEKVILIIEKKGMLPPSIADEGFLANLHKRHKDKHLIWELEDED